VSEGGTTKLGPWADDDFVGTVLAASAAGVDSDLPDEIRFMGGVAKLIRTRIAEAGDDTDPARPAVFLLEPTARTHRPDIAPKRAPMLDNALTAINGRLWFMSPVPVVGSYVELEDCDDDKLFRIVTDELQLGDVPAAIFDPRTAIPQLRLYRNGLGDPGTCEILRVDFVDVSLPRVFEIINRIYETGLVTPTAQEQAGKLWENDEKHWVAQDAELKVQLYLRMGLQGALLLCHVRSEEDIVSGRYDIAIMEVDPLDRSCARWHAILELKVLRTFGSRGGSYSDQDTRDRVESGVRQAASYRNEKGALAAALCCFDMRHENTGEECFSHVVDLADAHQVVLRTWFIYATCEQYREAIISSTEL